jgi:hypothetical protein
VAFESIDVSEHPEAMKDLLRFGVYRVPIVSRGDDWIDGQSLEALARIAGIDWTQQLRPVASLVQQIETIFQTDRALAPRIPPDKFAANLPQLKARKRPYASLSAHVGQILASFLDVVELNKRQEYAALDAPIPEHIRTLDDLSEFLEGVHGRFQSWWNGRGASTDFSAPADVYYGEQTIHQFLERTTWHMAQHTRQLQAALGELGITLERPLTDNDLQGLPIPEKIFDE